MASGKYKNVVIIGREKEFLIYMGIKATYLIWK